MSSYLRKRVDNFCWTMSSAPTALCAVLSHSLSDHGWSRPGARIAAGQPAEVSPGLPYVFHDVSDLVRAISQQGSCALLTWSPALLRRTTAMVSSTRTQHWFDRCQSAVLCPLCRPLRARSPSPPTAERVAPSPLPLPGRPLLVASLVLPGTPSRLLARGAPKLTDGPVKVRTSLAMAVFRVAAALRPNSTASTSAKRGRQLLCLPLLVQQLSATPRTDICTSRSKKSTLIPTSPCALLSAARHRVRPIPPNVRSSLLGPLCLPLPTPLVLRCDISRSRHATSARREERRRGGRTLRVAPCVMLVGCGLSNSRRSR